MELSIWTHHTGSNEHHYWLFWNGLILLNCRLQTLVLILKFRQKNISYCQFLGYSRSICRSTVWFILRDELTFSRSPFVLCLSLCNVKVLFDQPSNLSWSSIMKALFASFPIKKQTDEQIETCKHVTQFTHFNHIMVSKFPHRCLKIKNVVTRPIFLILHQFGQNRNISSHLVICVSPWFRL